MFTRAHGRSYFKALGIDLAEFDHLLAERDAFARQIQSCLPFTTATALLIADYTILAGVAMSKLKNLPPSKGYEPYFLEAGMSPIAARGLAGLAIKHGSRVAREAKHYKKVAEAIRFLAKVRQKAATAKRSRIILEAWRGTSVVENLFCSAGLQEFEFIRLLEELDEQGNTDYERLAHLAAEIEPHLSLSRGPKTSAASAAHAFLLNPDIPVPPRRRPHSRGDRTAENVDPLTEATRIEFSNPDLDTRPAKRRSKRLLRRSALPASKIE